jgi:5,5'-dehydrodivanillate O-demethylase
MSPQREHIVMHFRLPVDDTHTRIYRIEYTPGGDTSEMEWANPPVHYVPSFKDETGEFKLDTFGSQDGMAWETQGPILDRSLENLGTSDRGLVLYRRMLKEQILAVQQGQEPLGIIRDPKKNQRIVIPVSEGQGRMARKEMTSAAE